MLSERVSTMESERIQLQNQVSQLNGVIIALKNEQSEQSDIRIECERRLREKEQVISELGGVISTQKTSIVRLMRESDLQKELEEKMKEKEDQLVRVIEKDDSRVI